MPQIITRAERAKHLKTFILWLRVRRENTSRMVESLGLPTEAREEELFGPDETTFRELINLIGEACTKELNFLAQAGFPGIAFVKGDDEEIEASGRNASYAATRCSRRAKMATKIEQYNAAKREQTACLAWTALIGNRYHGGGGGIGELKSLSLGSVTVYHQYSDGATNYHEIPAALAPHLCAAIKARFGELVAEALARQDVALKAAAAEAVKEHGELLQAAGLAA